MNILRAFNTRLFDSIQPYRVTDDALMPWAYQFANPNGRPLHDDWGVMGKLSWLQPWQKVRRMDCAYRVPLPFDISGDVAVEEKWIIWDPSYPAAPGLRIEDRDARTDHGTFRVPHALVKYAGYGLAHYSAFIGGEWIPNVFTKYTGLHFGRRLSWYKGLHQDLHVSPPDENGITRSDLMAWYPELACSWVREV